MNDIRAAAINCEARKTAYRQTKEGVVVSFVIHPDEVPDALAVAPLGVRYMLAMVELADDETPVKREPAKRSYAQKAGILCGEPTFRRFLMEQFIALSDEPDEAARAVRLFCGVKSRAHLVEGTPAGDKWRELESRYDAWRRL